MKDCRAIVICDRGYGSLDLMETIRDQNADFLIRIRDSLLKETRALPMDECDVNIDFTIITDQTNASKKLTRETNTRFLPGLSKNKKKLVTWFHPSPYHMNLRIVRFPLKTGTYETIGTSLDKNEFPIEEIKSLYHLRWGIETSFRSLKYAIGLTSFHARKEESILQEIFARLLIYNFCSKIANSIVIEKNDENTYSYKINFTQAIHLCLSWMTI